LQPAGAFVNGLSVGERGFVIGDHRISLFTQGQEAYINGRLMLTLSISRGHAGGLTQPPAFLKPSIMLRVSKRRRGKWRTVLYR